MRHLLSITKALADPSRLRILWALRDGELCVCQIMELLALAPSTVSRHLSVLATGGLVESRKEGRWAYYRLPGRSASSEVRGALRWVESVREQEPAAQEDAARLEEILKLSPEELCDRQANGLRCCSSARGTRVEVKWRKGGPGRSCPA